MKKITSFFMVLVLMLGSVSFIHPTNVKAQNERQLPFTITFEKLTGDKISSIKFSSSEKVKIYIQEKDDTSKRAIYSGFSNNTISITGIRLNQEYNINVETHLGVLYTGSFTLYNKIESDVIGVIIDVNKVERTITDYDTDYSRMPKDNIIYETEKNDKIKTANKIFDSSIYGKIGKKGDEDFFQTMFYEEGDVIFILDDIPEGKDFDLYVYDSNEKQIASSCSTNSIESITIKDVKLNDWYYVKVVGYDKSFDKDNDYKFTVNRIPKKVIDYGHTFETAKVVTTIDGAHGEILFDGDSNYFKFTPIETGIYSIYTIGETDTLGYLYNQNKEELIRNDDMPNDLYGNFQMKKELNSNETYIIQVKHYSTGTGEFTLKVEKESSSVENPPKDNNSNMDNPIVTTSGIEYLNTFETSSSENWYSFTPEVTGSYKVNITGNGDNYGILFDDTKMNIIVENGNVFNTKTVELANTLIQGKTYYTKVTPKTFDPLNGQYILSIERLDKPNDESFKEQWGLLNQTNGIDINVLPAWKYSKGKMFKIGVADTGTDYNHPDLKNNIDLSLSYNFTHDMKDVFPIDENISNASAKTGHGTHVAGIIGAESNNEQGVVGISPESILIPLKVMGSRISDNPTYNGSIASFVKSVEYAKTNGIKLMNCSFGGYSPSASEKEAMLNAKEILFVIAAGNAGNDLNVNPEYPACYYHENSLVVAAINSNGQLSEFSNYGGPTNIAAPGEEIFSTYPGNMYTYNSGTSMATPVISAVAGLVWSNNLGLTPTEVKERIVSDDNVTKLSSLNNKIPNSGIVNAFKAITSDSIEVSTRSIKDVDRDVFGYSTKSTIKYYKDTTPDEEKTGSLIIKFVDNINVEEFIEKIKVENNFEKFEKTDYLKSINAYVFELSSISETDKVVDILNSDESVIYAEPNYVRKMN